MIKKTIIIVKGHSNTLSLSCFLLLLSLHYFICHNLDANSSLQSLLLCCQFDVILLSYHPDAFGKLSFLFIWMHLEQYVLSFTQSCPFAIGFLQSGIFYLAFSALSLISACLQLGAVYRFLQLMNIFALVLPTLNEYNHCIYFDEQMPTTFYFVYFFND